VHDINSQIKNREAQVSEPPYLSVNDTFPRGAGLRDSGSHGSRGPGGRADGTNEAAGKLSNASGIGSLDSLPSHAKKSVEKIRDRHISTSILLFSVFLTNRPTRLRRTDPSPHTHTDRKSERKRKEKKSEGGREREEREGERKKDK
jgi:hypothetical protein